jgi:vacuolar-type H+-ATPase subunit I/STV1
MPNRQLTLNVLLSLKERRERRVCSAITQLERKQSQLDKLGDELMQQRKTLWQQWRDCGGDEQLMTSTQWRQFRARLAKYYQQDQSLLEQIELGKRQRADLQQEKERQQQKLRQIQLEQEKLKIMME